MRAPLPEGLAFYRGGTNVIFRDVVGYRMHMSGRSISPEGRWFAMPLADHSIEIWSLSQLRPVRRLLGHTATFDALAWSLDGRLLATGGQDQLILIWDVEQGTLIRRLRGHQAQINSAAFSPDGRALYSGGSDHTIRVWTSFESDPLLDSTPLPPETTEARLAPGAHFLYAHSAKVGLRIFATHPAPRICHTANLSGARIWGVSPDGQTVVGADSQTDLCEVWRRDTKGYFVLRGAHQALQNVEGVPMFSGDGGRVVLLASDGSFGVWEVDPWRHVVTWQGAEPHTHGIMFDPAGKRVFVVCHNKGVVVGDIETGRVVPMPEPKPHVYSVAISSDNRFVATSASSGSVIIWAFAPGEDPRRLVTLSGESLFAWSLAFSPDGRRLAIGVENGEIRLWDIQHNMQVGVLKGHKQPVWELGFNPEEESLVSASPDELRIWRVTDPPTTTLALSPPKTVALSAAEGEGLPPSNDVALPPQTVYTRLAPGARFLCTADPGGIRIFDTHARRKIYDSQRIVGTLCGISPDAEWIVVAHPWAGICDVWRHESNDGLILPDEPNPERETNGSFKLLRGYHVLVKRDEKYQVAEKMVGVPAFSQNGRRVALLAADGTFGVWEVEPWRHVVNWDGAEPNEREIIFDPPGKRVFVVCPIKGVVVGDIETGRVVQMPMEQKSPISHVSISADNRFVATASWDNSVVLWAFAPGEDPRLLATVACEGVSASSLAFSPDGRRLALGMANGEIRIWDVEDKIQVGVLKGHQQAVWQLGFNFKDNSLVSVTTDELRVWPGAEWSHIAPGDPARVNCSGEKF